MSGGTIERGSGEREEAPGLREARLNIRISETEKELLQAAADRAKRTLSDWVRLTLHEAARARG